MVAVLLIMRLGFLRLVGVILQTTRTRASRWPQCGSAHRPRAQSDQRGFIVVGFIQRPQPGARRAAEGRDASAWHLLLELCERHEVDEIVVAMDELMQFASDVFFCARTVAWPAITELVAFLERETGRVRIDVLNPSWLIFGKGFKCWIYPAAECACA